MDINQIYNIITLGVFIVILLLFVVMPILWVIRQRLKFISETVEKVRLLITNMSIIVDVINDDIQSNFKNVENGYTIADSKATSIKDAIDVLSKVVQSSNVKLEAINHSVTKTTSNKRSRSNKSAKRIITSDNKKN